MPGRRVRAREAAPRAATPAIETRWVFVRRLWPGAEDMQTYLSKGTGTAADSATAAILSARKIPAQRPHIRTPIVDTSPRRTVPDPYRPRSHALYPSTTPLRK
ncbi:hypothetical protein GCM10010329_08920 [Streptomyces spiroverticillatus]|uniref:Uncharacterized protein n=1 Tax=Streptomyces finlayi TaxID=67296 RepID=A0A919CAP6_9ACTN|nr:hypothetical protein GCM10010329_08920 [Streptomyces spiroverticillatus]GHC94203.1 hypothetical protein GCM10010334_32150 [Streptomyces finlayi]